MARNSRFLDVILRASNRRLRSDLRSSLKDVKGFANRTRDLLRGGFAAGLGGFAGFASAQGIAEFGRQVLANEEALTRIGIQANLTEDQMAAVDKAATDTARAFGISKAEALGAATAIVNLEGASGFSAEQMTVLAQASVATGSSLTDLAGVGYALGNAFDISDPNELRDALSAVTEAGKQGSIPLAEMSTVLQQIGVNFSKVGASGKQGAAELAAALQIARKGFGSAAETGTGLKAFITQLEQNADKFRAFGVSVTRVGKDGVERLRPIREVLDDIGNSSIVKKKQFLTTVFGSAEARQFLDVMLANRQAFDGLSDAAVKSNAVQADSQRFLASTSGQLKIAIAEARGELEALFTPERLRKFVSLVKDDLVPALDFAVDHAKEIGIAIAAWKLLPMVGAMGTFTQGLGAAGAKAGGLLGVFGKMGGVVGGLLRTVVGFAGPIGLAITAGWALYEAFKSTGDQAERITEEQIMAAEIAGKAAGKRSQFDPTGRVSSRRTAAAQLRETSTAANKILFADDFAARISGRQRELARRGGGLAGEDVERLQALREQFVTSRGVLPEAEAAELQELLSRLFERELVGGAEGRAREEKASRLEAQASAIETVEKARFGKRDFDATSFDVAGAVAASGLTGKAAEAFTRQLLDELGRGGSTLDLAGGGVTAETATGPRRKHGVEAITGAIGAILGGRVKVSDPLAEEFAKLREAITGDREISVQIDGQEVARAVANNVGNRRNTP